MSDYSESNVSFDNNSNNEEEIYDSLNNKKDIKNKNNNNNINNVSINNEDSALMEAFTSLSNLPKKNKNEKKENNVKKTYSNDENGENEDNNNIYNKEDEIKTLKINNDEENVNLGNSFSLISNRDKKNKININEDNNNQEVVTPNTSINNLSETLTKKSGQEINITNKNIKSYIKTNNNNCKDVEIKNEKEDENNKENNKEINNKESCNIFDDESLVYSKKQNFSEVKNDINPNEEENKLLYNINIQFSKIRKASENDNDLNNGNNEEKIINLTDKNIINNNKNKKYKTSILKRFEQLTKNKNNNLETPNSIKFTPDINNDDNNNQNNNNNNNNNIINQSNNNNNNQISQEQENSKINDNYLSNSFKDTINNINIYLCPFCNKETPEITKIEGIQNDIKTPTLDKIYISCSCGNYELTLSEYIQKIEENESNKYKDFCYNENHDLIKGVSYCAKCDKWFCQQCLYYHKSLLPDHIITPTKIPKYFICKEHFENIIFYCTKCNIGICQKCKVNHFDHYVLNMDEYFNKTYKSLPFKTFEELNEFIEHCNRISEKEKNSYIDYIDNMIKKLNELKNDILENYNLSKIRRFNQQKLVKYLFGNFICFSDNYLQIKNMNSINFICPTLFLYHDINFLKASNNYSLYLRKESFIEINPDKKLSKDRINKIFEKYKSILKEMHLKTNKSNNEINPIYLNTIQSENNISYPTLFKIYNNSGIYYGEIENNKRGGVGKQFNQKNEFEGIWKDGEIIKGKAIYYSDQGNIIYEGEFVDGIENGYGEKIYPNKRVYKGRFVNGKIDTKYEIQKKLEIANN